MSKKDEIPSIEDVARDLVKELGGTKEHEKLLIDISNEILKEMKEDLWNKHHPLGPKLEWPVCH